MVQGERTKAVSIFKYRCYKAKQKLNAGFGITDAAISWTTNAVAPVDTKRRKPSKRQMNLSSVGAIGV